jgi:hypothetical protein
VIEHPFEYSTETSTSPNTSPDEGLDGGQSLGSSGSLVCYSASDEIFALLGAK